jgi:hypothetical protein
VQIVALACDLLAWTHLLALTGPARRREPKLFEVLMPASGYRNAWQATAACPGMQNKTGA